MSDTAGQALEAALSVLRREGCVGFPTETVWGLAACARSAVALRRLHDWKGRDDGKPIAVLVSAPARLGTLGIEPSDAIARLLRRFWPGPLTVIFPDVEGLAPGIANERGGVGVRCSPHPSARALAAGAEGAGLGPLTATSLNRSGEPPARSLAEARAVVAKSHPGPSPVLFGEAGPDAGGAEPSSVLDLSGERPAVVREGAIRRDVLESALAEVGLSLAPGPDSPSPLDPVSHATRAGASPTASGASDS